MINKIKENIFQFYFSQFGSCVYLLKLKGKNILIDTSSKDNQKELIKDLDKIKLNPENIDIILLTHNHWDHIENLDLFSNAKIYSSKNINKLKIPELKIIKTPGHTQDDICIFYDDILFSGDTIFHNEGIGRTDFPESSHDEMIKSLKKLENIDYKILCPGHIN